MTKKRPSVKEVVAKSIKQKKPKIPIDWFDINSSKGLVNIPLLQIVPNPDQPRKTFNEETILELANSMKDDGIISPIMVRPKDGKYEIVAGERRWRAAEKAGLKEIPALIRKVSKSQALRISLKENMQRDDLNPVDRAKSLKEAKKIWGVSWDKLALEIGLSKRRILELVNLLDLPKAVREDIKQKNLTARHGTALRKLKDNKEEMIKVAKIAKEESLSGDETEKLVKKFKVRNRFGNIPELKRKRELEKEIEKRKELTGGFVEKGRKFLEDSENVEV